MTLARISDRLIDTVSLAVEGPPAHFGLPQGARLEPIATAAAFAALEADWHALERQTPAATIFQSFDWLQAWIETYGAGPAAAQPFVVTGRVEGRLVFAWPLMRQRLGPLVQLRWMSEPLSQYGDVLMAPGQCPEAWLPAALSLIRREAKADLLWLRHVRADAVAAPFLATEFHDSQLHDFAPVLDLRAFANDAAYDARYTGSQRKRRRKIRKAIEDAIGPLSFAVLEPGAAKHGAIAAAVAEKERWLSDRGRHNQAIDDTATVAFLSALDRRGAGTVAVHVSQVSAGARPISWQIGLRKGASHFGFITAHVNELTDYSPGRLHMDFSQRQALQDGLSAFDLMVPDDPHKESWSSRKVEVRDHHLPLTALGRLYGAGYLEHLRPLLRRAYSGMSPRLLKLLKPLTGH